MSRYLVLLGLLVAGCDTSPEMPGTPLGTYKIQAAITQNTCGGGLGAPDPWAFEARLSREENLLHWSQDGRLSSGTVDADSKATIQSVQRGQAGAKGGCSMERTDTLEVKLPANGSKQGFLGALVFSFAVEEGGTCGELLTSQGGAYEALPCEIHYDLTSERSGD